MRTKVEEMGIGLGLDMTATSEEIYNKIVEVRDSKEYEFIYDVIRNENLPRIALAGFWRTSPICLLCTNGSSASIPWMMLYG